MLSNATLPGGAATAIGLTVAHVALSTLVTGHVLLFKRDVGASIGWIGLAWLSPVFGAVLYFLFGINRVRERAKLLSRPHAAARRRGPARPGRHGHALAALDRASHWITGRPAESGNAVALLRNGDEAYPPMLAEIERATSRVLLSSYIFRDDAAGAPFVDALIRARRRQVSVSVLIDGIGGGYFRSPACRRLREGGVPVVRFLHSPLPWRMPFLNLRSHKKILVVDDRVAFTGGLNIGRENLVHSRPADPVRDTHFRLAGPVVGQLAAAFARDWAFITGADLPVAAAAPEGGEAAGSVTARVITSGPDHDLEKIEFLALQAIGCAQRSVEIMTPYFLPDERLVTALALAAMRGVEVDIVVPERSNHRLVDWGMRAHVGPLLAAGCRIWLNRPPFDHSKLMVVDGGWSLIGSSNWDMRSLRLNFELDVEIYDTETARLIAEVMRGKRGRALEALDLEQRPFAARLRDAAARLLLPYV